MDSSPVGESAAGYKEPVQQQCSRLVPPSGTTWAQELSFVVVGIDPDSETSGVDGRGARVPTG